MTEAPPVMFCGAWDEGCGYPRTAGLRRGLERAGHRVIECRAPGLAVDKKKLLRQPWRWPSAWLRARRDRRELRRRLARRLDADAPRCIVVPYPGHHLVADIKACANVPVVLDLFLSAYDTVVEDRRLCEPGSLGAWAMRHFDTRACAAADLVLLDTPENAAYVAALTGLPAERFAWLPLCDPEAADGPLPMPARGDRLRVLFFGTGVPLHGLDTLIDAAAAVPGIHLTLVGGTSSDRERAVAALGDRLSLQPEFVDRVRLRELMEVSHLVAGVFGRSGKAQRVVPWKVVIALAAGRPVVTADTPAVAGWLEGSGATFLSPANEHGALAALLGELARDHDRVERAAATARAAYDRHFGCERAARRWSELLDRVTAGELAEVRA